MDLYSLVMPLGIITYVLILLAILTAKRIIKLNFKWHRRFGISALIFATLHAGIVIYYNV
jgi:uncharacterized membrane protein YozB (DUF420 family)